MELNGWQIMNQKVLKEIKNLKRHIKGELPPGAGTNRNERLHRHLKPLFSRTPMGLPMALALMTVLLFQYNSRLLGIKTSTYLSLQNQMAVDLTTILALLIRRFSKIYGVSLKMTLKVTH